MQILEAAKLLVGMGAQPETPPLDSTFEPSSPSLSNGFSEQMDGQSSARTTPPPQADEYSDMPIDEDMNMSEYEDDGSGVLSRQLRKENTFGSAYRPGYLEPSPTPGRSLTEAEDDVARAVADMSFSYPRMAPDLAQSPYMSSYHSCQAPESFTRGQTFPRGQEFTSSEMDQDVASRMDEDDDDSRARSRSDEEECGPFQMDV